MSPHLVQTRFGWDVNHIKPCDCDNGRVLVCPHGQSCNCDGVTDDCGTCGGSGEWFDDACACRECEAMQVEADALNAAAFAGWEKVVAA